MTPEQWATIKHFKPSEKWGDPAKMDAALIYELERLRTYLAKPIIIHCGFEKRENGYHPLGMAVDCHVPGLHPMELCIAASRFAFGGIGVYLWWENPGLHLDKRIIHPGMSRAYWGSITQGDYVAMDAAFFLAAMQIKV